MKSNTLIHRLIAAPLKATSRGIRNAVIASALLIASASISSAVPTVTATNNDTTAHGDGTSRPGEQITYTISIGNSGTTAATAVQLADAVDARTTFVNNSVKLSPNAIAHAYNAAGNTQLSINAATGLKNGVVDLDGVTPVGSIVVTTGTFATSQGGSVTISADGSFIYTPQTGDRIASDTFSYTVTDGDNLPSTGLVTLNLNNTIVWYVDSAFGGVSDGSSAKPYKTLAEVSGATGGDAANEIIFIIERAGDYDGNLTLLNGQQLYGGGTTLVVNTITINTAGANTTMVTTVAATNSITLGSGNTVTGFTIGNTTGSKIFGSSFGTLVLSNVVLQGSGQALNLTTGVFGDSAGAGTGSVFTSVTFEQWGEQHQPRQCHRQSELRDGRAERRDRHIVPHWHCGGQQWRHCDHRLCGHDHAEHVRPGADLVSKSHRRNGDPYRRRHGERGGGCRHFAAQQYGLDH